MALLSDDRSIRRKKKTMELQRRTSDKLPRLLSFEQ